MPRLTTRSLALPSVLFLAAFAALVAAGCDANDEADEADFEVLENGDWIVDSLAIDGRDRTQRLLNQYEEEMTLIFSENDTASDREFEFFARRSDRPEDNLLVNGALTIDADDHELTFFPNTAERFTLRYQILQNDRVALTTEDDERDGLVLRDLLLPGTTLGDQFPELRIVITTTQ